MKIFQSSAKQLIILFAWADASRMLTGAIHALYLLSTGVSLGELAGLQIIYSLAFLSLEIPTTWFAIHFNAKRSVILGVLCWSAYFFLCLTAPNLWVLSFAMIIYALGACFLSGALDEWLILSLSKEYPNDLKKIHYYQHMLDEYFSLFTIAMGGIGAALGYFSHLHYPIVYILTAITMLIIAFLLTKQSYYRSFEITSRHLTISKKIKNDIISPIFRFCRLTSFRYYLAICVLITCIYQPVYHYWQPFFVELIENNKIILNSDISLLMGVVFVSYCLCRFLAHRYLRKNRHRYHSFVIVLISIVITIVTIYQLSVPISTISLAVILFSIFHAAFSITFTEVRSHFLQSVNSENISLAISSITAVSRIFSVVFLSYIGVYLTAHSLLSLFKWLPWLCSCVFVLIICWHLQEKYSWKIIK